MDVFCIARENRGLKDDEIRLALRRSLEKRQPKRVLIVPPDITRIYSGAGFITNEYYRELALCGASVDVMPALGTHDPMTRREAAQMYGGVPYERFITHDWRRDVTTLGVIDAGYVSDVTGGLWREGVEAEVNGRIVSGEYDLIISVGQVVPHEVAGMSNHAKNIFVGVGGSDMINKSHMIGAVYGMERMMGRDHSPVRKLFDYGMERFLPGVPILFALTVTTAERGEIAMHGLFIGEGRECFNQAVKLSQEKNIDFVERGIKKCVVYLEPGEFKSTWLGNKAVYRTRMAMADGGELIVLAPGVAKFGEDAQVDRLIRKYGYRGRLNMLELVNDPKNGDLRANMSAAAHLIHGSSDGRFEITYAVKNMTRDEITSVGFNAADYDETAAKYNPEKLEYGYNTVGAEEVFFIPNPALGLWISKERFGDGK